MNLRSWLSGPTVEFQLTNFDGIAFKKKLYRAAKNGNNLNCRQNLIQLTLPPTPPNIVSELETISTAAISSVWTPLNSSVFVYTILSFLYCCFMPSSVSVSWSVGQSIAVTETSWISAFFNRSERGRMNLKLPTLWPSLKPINQSINNPINQSIKYPFSFLYFPLETDIADELEAELSLASARANARSLARDQDLGIKMAVKNSAKAKRKKKDDDDDDDDAGLFDTHSRGKKKWGSRW